MRKITINSKPLSVNAAFQGRRFKTKKCTTYEKEVFCQLPKLNIPGFVNIHYDFYLKNWKLTDADNLVKVLQDILVKRGIIEDDRKIMRYIIEKHQSKENYIKIEIEKHE